MKKNFMMMILRNMRKMIVKSVLIKIFYYNYPPCYFIMSVSQSREYMLNSPVITTVLPPNTFIYYIYFIFYSLDSDFIIVTLIVILTSIKQVISFIQKILRFKAFFPKGINFFLSSFRSLLIQIKHLAFCLYLAKSNSVFHKNLHYLPLQKYLHFLALLIFFFFKVQSVKFLSFLL